jgi:2-hydroxychromene-2-carboxylate isomerase
MSSVEFFFDYGSPYSYLANSRLEGLVKRTGTKVDYRPMLLGGVFKATGNRSPFMEPVEAKKRYFSLELRRTVEGLGVAFEHNPHFPINTLGLMRAAHAAQSLGVFPAFHAAIYPAFWAKAADLGQSEVIEVVLSEAGLDGKKILELSVGDESKVSLRTTTDEAVERGVFGAPTFFVADEMYFGNDRMDLVEEALAGRKAV